MCQGLSKDDKSFLSLILRAEDSDGKMFSQKEVEDQSFLFLLAGYETTANAISFSLYLITKHSGAGLCSMVISVFHGLVNTP
jgi:cytochrome P450